MRAIAARLGAPLRCLAGVAVTCALLGPAPALGRAVGPTCKHAATETWLGLGEGGGTAGTIYYPLEFSNIGRQACSLNGYPGVSGITVTGKPVGKPADRNNSAHGTVVLAPGATAHAILGIHAAGAICSKSVNAAGLRVYAPGQTGSETVPFGFPACAGPSVMTVGPVRAGTGIPGYTTS